MHDAMPVAEMIHTLSYDHDRMRDVGGRILDAIECCNVEAARNDLLEFQFIQDSHFWFQNRLMEAADYPQAAEHIGNHERLATVLLAINGVLCTGRFSALTDEVAGIIRESLDHIDDMDQPFHDFLVQERSY